MSKPSARALAGWKRIHGEHGIVLTLQLVDSVEQYQARDFERVEVALNDRQLRSLARDLARAARTRGVELYPKRPWWRFWERRRS